MSALQGSVWRPVIGILAIIVLTMALLDIPANAHVAPEQVEQFELLAAPRGAPDDLTKLNGVGPQLAGKLNDAGVFHYWQLAAMKPEDATKLDTELKLHGRIDRDGWIGQARALIDAA